MGIDRLYYYVAGIAIASLLCVSHIKLEWPEQGWHPTSSMGNNWRKARERAERKAEAAAKEEAARPVRRDGRRSERSRARDPRRRQSRTRGRRAERDYELEYRGRSASSERESPVRATGYRVRPVYAGHITGGHFSH
ncbi:hypothetical protein Tdes44962_MAKER01533 [Teratosphaeria destructans]|uniref:Uncharacterized protein n=1 Tax=Teratosphaeria destructans TaxID=418781 RepID=A0A9W7SYY6_9PEZI|nr:hypothetical protein Tdes44962_MAKER01533 [Teratosphaeria destructans]